MGIPTLMFTLEGRGHLFLNCGNTHTYVYIRGAIYYYTVEIPTYVYIKGGVIYSYIVEIPTLMFTLAFIKHAY